MRGKCRAIAVSNAYELAPWADALVSNDAGWWRFHENAINFAGRKFCGVDYPDTEKVKFEGAVTMGSNSGLLAMHIAVNIFGAKRLLLCGFDMRGSHYFGPHPAPLKNTKPKRFDAFIEQFMFFRPRGVEIVNCTPGSAITAYKRGELEACLSDNARWSITGTVHEYSPETSGPYS